MSEFKNGFTLVEILITMTMLVGIFSMALSILGSFSNNNFQHRNIDEDINSARLIFDDIRYLRMTGEENISLSCEVNIIKLSTFEIVDEVQLKHLTCTDNFQINVELPDSTGKMVGELLKPISIQFQDGLSSTTEIVINKFGYVSM